MRYVKAREPGPPEVLSLDTTSTPSPKAGEVLIEVSYAGVNRPDCIQRAGLYPPPPDASPIIGLEVSGRVVALGDGVSEWRVGDFVCALTPGGGYAEYCLAPAAHCLPLPRGLALLEAASLPENYFTVWNNLFDRVHLIAGETVLVHGGSGGIGLAAIQLAKAFDDDRSRLAFTYVPDDDLAGLYSGAACVAIVSLYEGFGMPALEALACGAPLVASNRGSLPEIVGNDGIVVDPLDVTSIAEALSRAVNNQAALAAAGPARAAEFTWSAAARVTRTALERAFRSPAGRPPRGPTPSAAS